MENQIVIRKILHFGDRYKNELIKRFPKGSLETEWYRGLSLFLNHSFYQGRRDEVSEEVEKAAMPVLDRYFKDKNVSALLSCNLGSLFRHLSKVVGKGKIGKGGDIKMIISIFEFVRTLPPADKNLASYSVSEIKQNNTPKLYKELKTIYQVGSKIASFYLRDLVDLYDLESLIRAEDLRYLQPIDVWVRKVACKTGIIRDEGLSDENVRDSILRTCHGMSISAFRFNQGAWYAGKHAFDILIEYLDEIQP